MDEARFTHLAVADDVDTGINLAANNVEDDGAESILVIVAGWALEQIVRPG
jgi:hypothetical protein